MRKWIIDDDASQEVFPAVVYRDTTTGVTMTVAKKTASVENGNRTVVAVMFCNELNGHDCEESAMSLMRHLTNMENITVSLTSDGDDPIVFASEDVSGKNTKVDAQT